MLFLTCSNCHLQKFSRYEKEIVIVKGHVVSSDNVVEKKKKTIFMILLL